MNLFKFAASLRGEIFSPFRDLKLDAPKIARRFLFSHFMFVLDSERIKKKLKLIPNPAFGWYFTFH